ncbi:MAG: hypothetical protein QXG17_07390 [Sulfolobales archaeon]
MWRSFGVFAGLIGSLRSKCYRDVLSVLHYAYGAALLLYLLSSSLYVGSLLHVGFFLVVRRVSYYVVVSGGEHSILMVAAACALILLSPALWWRASRAVRLAITIVPFSAALMLIAPPSAVSLATGIAASVLSSIYVLTSSAHAYRGFTWCWFAVVLVSAISTALRALGLVHTVPEFTVVDYIFGMLGKSSPYLVFFLTASPVAAVATSILKRRPGYLAEASRTGEMKLLVCSALLSSLLYMVPYTTAVNPRGLVATTDILVYVELLDKMRISGDPLRSALSMRYGDRFLYLLLLYFIQKLTGVDSWTISTVSGWVWAPLLTVSVWYMVKRFYGATAAAHAALLTPLSAQLLGFIYGGFQANHLNLAVLFFSAGLLSEKSLRKKVAGALLVFASPGIHAWSYLHVVPALVLWAVIELIRRRDRESVTRLAVLLLALFASILTIVNLTGSLGYILSLVEKWVMRLALSRPITDKLAGLSLALAIYVWGSLNSPVLYLASIGGQVMRLVKQDLPEHTPLDYLMLLTLAGFFALSADISLVSRLILNTPLHALAGVLLANSSRETNVLLYSSTTYASIYLVLNAPP